MKNQMTSRDYELISAYLDDQLGSKERARFEDRLNIDPVLRRELHEIGKTRLLLRGMPKLRAPRNYYIKPESQAQPVVRRPAWRFAPAYGIVSAIATILLVIVIFGDKLLVSPTQVALAPAPERSLETTTIQQQAQSKTAASPAPTEEAPLAMMSAPVIEETTAPSAELSIGETGIPTPTTVYLYAYPPTPTTESIYVQGTGSANLTCEEYLDSGAYPTESYVNNCPTPTYTPYRYLESIQPSATPTPTGTSTPTITSTLTENLPNLPPASTETQTATPSPSPTPTDTPSPTPSLTPYPTETPTPLSDIEATHAASAPFGLGVASQDQSAISPTPKQAQVTAPPVTSPDVSFMRYLLLAVEISLAVIAVAAGVTAIILRMRAGR